MFFILLYNSIIYFLFILGIYSKLKGGGANSKEQIITVRSFWNSYLHWVLLYVWPLAESWKKLLLLYMMSNSFFRNLRTVSGLFFGNFSFKDFQLFRDFFRFLPLTIWIRFWSVRSSFFDKNLRKICSPTLSLTKMTLSASICSFIRVCDDLATLSINRFFFSFE